MEKLTETNVTTKEFNEPLDFSQILEDNDFIYYQRLTPRQKLLFEYGFMCSCEAIQKKKVELK